MISPFLDNVLKYSGVISLFLTCSHFVYKAYRSRMKYSVYIPHDYPACFSHRTEPSGKEIYLVDFHFVLNNLSLDDLSISQFVVYDDDGSVYYSIMHEVTLAVRQHDYMKHNGNKDTIISPLLSDHFPVNIQPKTSRTIRACFEMPIEASIKRIVAITNKHNIEMNDLVSVINNEKQRIDECY